MITTLLDKKYKPQRVYKDQHKELYDNVFHHTIPKTPVQPINVKPYPIIKTMNFGYEIKPQNYPVENTHVFSNNGLHSHIIKAPHNYDLEEDVLKPFLGLEDKQVPDAVNTNYYQFNLAGKTAKDIAIDNAQEEITPLDILKENAETGDPLKTSGQNLKQKQQLTKLKDKLIKSIKERNKDKSKGESPKEIPLKPVVEKEVIPITEDDEAKQVLDEMVKKIIDEEEKEKAEELTKTPVFKASKKKVKDLDEKEAVLDKITGVPEHILGIIKTMQKGESPVLGELDIGKVEEQLMKLKVKELQEIAKKYRLSSSGIKASVVQRLIGHLKQLDSYDPAGIIAMDAYGKEV